MIECCCALGGSGVLHHSYTLVPICEVQWGWAAWTWMDGRRAIRLGTRQLDGGMPCSLPCCCGVVIVGVVTAVRHTALVCCGFVGYHRIKYTSRKALLV